MVILLLLISDTNQLDKQMAKDTTNSSQLGQSSQHTRQGPPNLNRRRTEHEPKYQLFFLVVFLQDKLSK